MPTLSMLPNEGCKINPPHKKSEKRKNNIKYISRKENILSQNKNWKNHPSETKAKKKKV